MDLDERAAVHAALGDPIRLSMVDRLMQGDRTFQDLAEGAELPTNLAAHHLHVLETARLIERRVSEGDHRRRYISLRLERLEGLARPQQALPKTVLFVCTHNSARSQFAAARWRQVTGLEALSAGMAPAERVHPGAVRAARTFDVDLTRARPNGYEVITSAPDLIVSVCDRARESGLPFASPALHWSVPDPVHTGTSKAFHVAFAEIVERIDHLAVSIH
jgi:protein-tyrosine-phosphatase